MSRIFEALRRSDLERGIHPAAVPDAIAPITPVDVTATGAAAAGALEHSHDVHAHPREDARLIALTQPQSVAAEKYRTLATRLRMLQEQSRLKVVVLTSAVAEEGKSVSSANLALTLARSGRQRVLLLEGDLRRPVVAQMFGLRDSSGLTQWLEASTEEPAPLLHVDGTALFLLPAGTPGPDPIELLQSERLKALLQQMRTEFDWIIIDTPPVGLLSDANIWARLADASLLVVREGKTPKQMLRRALQNLERRSLLGVILNQAHVQESAYDRYYAYKPQAQSVPVAKSA